MFKWYYYQAEKNKNRVLTSYTQKHSKDSILFYGGQNAEENKGLVQLNKK